MTYRDAVKEGKQFVKDFPSTCTINQRVKGERSFQLDLIHLLRDTSFKLWQDGEMTPEDRKEIIRRLESVLFVLKNSAEKHRVNKDLYALKRRTREERFRGIQIL